MQELIEKLTNELNTLLVAADGGERVSPVSILDMLEVVRELRTEAEKSQAAAAEIQDIRRAVDTYSVHELTAWLVERRLHQNDWVKIRTADSLGWERSTLDRWIKREHISIKST